MCWVFARTAAAGLGGSSRNARCRAARPGIALREALVPDGPHARAVVGVEGLAQPLFAHAAVERPARDGGGHRDVEIRREADGGQEEVPVGGIAQRVAHAPLLAADHQHHLVGERHGLDRPRVLAEVGDEDPAPLGSHRRDERLGVAIPGQIDPALRPHRERALDAMHPGRLDDVHLLQAQGVRRAHDGRRVARAHEVVEGPRPTSACDAPARARRRAGAPAPRTGSRRAAPRRAGSRPRKARRSDGRARPRPRACPRSRVCRATDRGPPPRRGARGRRGRARRARAARSRPRPACAGGGATQASPTLRQTATPASASRSPAIRMSSSISSR